MHVVVWAGYSLDCSFLCFLHPELVSPLPVKLAKQVMHKTASGSLLAQSYLSTVLLFAGLYTLEYRFQVSE